MKKKQIFHNEKFNLHSFYERFPNEESCREYLIKERFPNGKIVCPKCATYNKIYNLKDGIRYKCGNCKHIFTITVGTIFEASHVPLQKWFLAIYIISAHKKGVSSLQLHRDIGVTQKTAWFMLHRVRHLLAIRTKAQILGGEVEIDEMYWGAKEKFMHVDKRAELKKKFKHGSSVNPFTKIPIIGLVQRSGAVVTTPVISADAYTAYDLIQEKVKDGSMIYTDQNRIYGELTKPYKHEIIVHQREYVRGRVHTNTIEGYWSLLRRGIIGIYHYVSVKHLHRYCDEFQYRYNTRKLDDAERFRFTIRHTEARLKYETLITTSWKNEH